MHTALLEKIQFFKICKLSSDLLTATGFCSLLSTSQLHTHYWLYSLLYTIIPAEYLLTLPQPLHFWQSYSLLYFYRKAKLNSYNTTIDLKSIWQDFQTEIFSLSRYLSSRYQAIKKIPRFSCETHIFRIRLSTAGHSASKSPSYGLPLHFSRKACQPGFQ